MKRTFLIGLAALALSSPAFSQAAPGGDDGGGNGIATGIAEAYTTSQAVYGVASERDRLQTYRLGAGRPVELSGLAPVPLTGRDALMAARR